MASKKARALFDFTYQEQNIRCDDVVSASAAIITNLEKSGMVDANTDAVKYCESDLKKQEVKLTGKAPAKPKED